MIDSTASPQPISSSALGLTNGVTVTRPCRPPTRSGCTSSMISTIDSPSVCDERIDVDARLRLGAQSFQLADDLRKLLDILIATAQDDDVQVGQRLDVQIFESRHVRHDGTQVGASWPAASLPPGCGLLEIVDQPHRVSRRGRRRGGTDPDATPARQPASDSGARPRYASTASSTWLGRRAFDMREHVSCARAGPPYPGPRRTSRTGRRAARAHACARCGDCGLAKTPARAVGPPAGHTRPAPSR